MMMEQPPASLSSPTVSAVNTAAKLQITPEGGLRLVTDKDVLGKEGSANGQAQQQPQQKFFATRTQDGKWNLLMAPTSDPSRLFLVQPTGGQRFQLAPSRPGCVTLRHEVTSALRTASSSSSSSSNPANGTASSSKDAGSQGSDDESVVPHHDAVVVPVPQLRATSASLSSIVPPKTSTARRATSASKLTSSGKPQVPPAAQKEHLGTAHPAGSKTGAVRVAVSGRDNLKSNSGGKASKGGTRLALMSSGSKSKIVLVDAATLDKAGGKAGDGGELGLTIAVPTLVVPSVADSPLSKPGKTSLSSPSTMADSCRTVPATTTACSTTATITAVTTTTTTVTTTTTTTVTNSSTTDPASLPGLRTRPPAAACGTWRRSSVAASTAELPSRKKMAESSDSRKVTNVRVNDDPGEDADVEKTGENLSVNSTKEYNDQCFEKISNGKRIQPNDETSDGGKTSDDESDSADCVPPVAHTMLREEICDEKIDKAGKESAESQENSSKVRDVPKEQLGSDGAVRCAETANEPDSAATRGSGDACEHDGRGVSEQTNLREVEDEEPGQKGKGRKQKKPKQKADESVRRKLRARIRVSDKTSEPTSAPSVPQVPARRRETVGVSTKSVPVDNSEDVSEQPPRVSYRAEEKNTHCTSHKAAQSVNEKPSRKRAQSESQTPSSKGVQSESQTLSRKGVQTENETPSDKAVLSENETLSDKGVQSENETPSDKGVQSENETPSDKGVQSENEAPSDKGVQSEIETPSDKGVQSENETPSDTGVQSQKETPSGKGVQSENETPPNKGVQAENQTPSDKESQAENETLSGKEASAENETSSDKGLQSQTETSERLMQSEKVTKSRTKTLSSKRTNKTPSESETQSKNEAPSDKGIQSKTDTLSDEGTQSRSETLMNKGKQLNKKPQKVPQSKHGTQLEKGTPSGNETPPEKTIESKNETSQKKIQSEKPRSSDVTLLSKAETPSDKENTLSEKATPEVLEKAEMYTTAFVVLERLTNRDIAFLCRKFRNARVRSRCSALCRLQTLRHLCSIGAISCEERLLASSTHRKTSSGAETLPEAAVAVDDSSSTDSCNEDELDKSILRRKRRQKKKPAKDMNAKKSKPSEKLTDLDSPRFVASSVVSSKEPIIIRVSPSSQAGSSVMQNSNPQNQTNLPKAATTRYAVTPAICRPLVSTPVPPVQTVSAIPRNAVLLPKPSLVGIADPRNAVMLPKLPSATEGSSVSLKQATRKSLSQAISNSLARKAATLSVASDPVSPSIPNVPVTLSSSLSSPRLILATCTSPSAMRCLKEALQSSGVPSPASATATPTVRIPATSHPTIKPPATSHPTIKPPATSATIPTTTTITSAASVQSGKVIVNSGSSLNKQFYLVQIGDKRLLVPITTPTTTTISAASSSSSSSVPMVVSTSASVPVCLSSVVTSSARSTVLLASKSGGVVSSTALPALRPFSPAPSILHSKNTTAASASKLANRPWSGPRTVASGDNRVILLPVGSVPPLVSGAGEAAGNSSLVRRVNIVGSPPSLASLRPLSSTSLLKAVAKSNLVQQNLRPPGPTGKRASTMTEAERLAKRARLEKKYPLPPGVVIKTEPEIRGYGDEGVATTAATTTPSTTSNSTCIIRIAASASSTAGVRPGVGTQGIRVGGPFIIRGGTLSAPIFTFVPAVTAAVTSGAVVTSAATAVTAGATAALGSASESAAASSILGTSVPAVTLAATTVTELTQAEPVASLITQTSTSFSSSSSSSSSPSSAAMLPPPRSQSSSPLVESILQRHASVAVDSSSPGRATPDVTVTCARQPSDATPPATAALPAEEPDAAAPAGVRSSASAPTTAASSPAAPSPCPPTVASPSPLASLGAMWVRQAADSPDTLPQHVDARSLKGDRVRRLRETLAKQLQDLGDERKQRALQALEKQLGVDD